MRKGPDHYMYQGDSSPGFEEARQKLLVSDAEIEKRFGISLFAATDAKALINWHWSGLRTGSADKYDVAVRDFYEQAEKVFQLADEGMREDYRQLLNKLATYYNTVNGLGFQKKRLKNY